VGDVVQRLLALPAQGATAAFTPDPVAEAQPKAPEPGTHPAPSLTLSDLDGADAEILEKTLITVPEALPEAKAEQAPSFPPEITETTLSGYTSARDAIEKLFANAPATSGPKPNPESSAMDMEATLSALESTLGTSAKPRPLDQGSLGDGPTASGLTVGALGPSSSTMRLSQEDLLAALAAAPAPAPAPAPAEPTVPLRAPDLLAAQSSTTSAPSAPTRAFTPLPDASDTGAELLRLKIGEDIYGGLTMPQLITWVEEGRILENHLVARQHSENWLEAHKVPGLRPIFDRLRRERSSGAPSLDSGAIEPAPRKSLFGGLFGKG
jgi:hypothetical protein